MGFEGIAAQAAAASAQGTETPAAEGAGDGFIRPDSRESDQPITDPSSLNTEDQEPAIQNDPKDEWAKKFSKLAQTERQMMMERQKIKREQEELARMRQEHETFQEKVKRWEELQKLKKEDPLSWLEKEEMPYDVLSESIVNNEDYARGAEFRQMKSMMQEMRQEFKKELEELRQFKENSTKEKQSEQIEQYHSQVRDHVTQNAEKYELISSMGDTQVLLEMQGHYYKQHGELADLDKLCQQYETYLEKELFDNQLGKMQKLKKYQERMGISQQAQEQQKQAPQREPENPFVHRSTPPTLNNSLTSETPPQKRPTTQEERMKRAMSILNANNSL